MNAAFILSVAIPLVAPFCDSPVHVVDIPPARSVEAWGEYTGKILIDPDVPRHMLRLVALHEAFHCQWAKMPPKKQAIIRKRLYGRPYIYSPDPEEEFAEIFALSHLR